MKINQSSKNIPVNWSQRLLGDLLIHEKGKLPKVLSTEKTDRASVPYLTIKTIDGGAPQFTSKNDGVFATKDDILIVADGSGSGRIYRGYEGILSSTFFKVSTKNERDLTNDFAQQLLSHINLMKAEFRKGAAIPHLNFAEVKKLLVLLPPVKEQEYITEILITVDHEIQNVVKLISHSQKLKNALMVELFSKGIKHKKLKKTEVGLIPEDWDTVLIDSVAKRGSGHTPNKQHPEYWNEGISWVSLSDSNKLDNRYIDQTDKEISLLGIENSSAVLHAKDAVIICRDAGIGKVAILGKSNMAVSQHFIAWQCSERLSNIYLYYLLQSWRKKFERIATGTTIKTIGLPYFKELKIPLPDVEEQKKIGNILWLIDDKIHMLKLLRNNLSKLKKGLMSDLLYGKVKTANK